MKSNLPKISAISISSLSLVLLFTTSALAAQPVGRGLGNDKIPANAMARLEGAKLKSCQAREVAIKNRSEKLTQLASTMMTKFDAIALRVQEYYTTKLVPQGKTVANYDALVADVQTNKLAVQTALTTAQADAASFSCTAESPKEMLTKFNTDMRAVKTALHAYRTSIKNLIVGVRSVTGQENRARPALESTGNTGQGDSAEGESE